MLCYLVVGKIIYNITKFSDKQKFMRIGSVAGIPKNLKMYFSPGEFSQYFVVLQHTTSASSPSSSVNSKLASCKPASSSQSLVCPAPKWQLIKIKQATTVWWVRVLISGAAGLPHRTALRLSPGIVWVVWSRDGQPSQLGIDVSVVKKPKERDLWELSLHITSSGHY